MMEKVYKVVIIDDEECAIDNLCFELKKYGSSDISSDTAIM